MANIVELKDSTSTKCYPLTKAQAVYFDDGSTVAELKDDIKYNGDKYFPKKNLVNPNYLELGSNSYAELIENDDCNIIHLTNSGSSAYAYIDIGDIQAGDTLYFSFMLKGSAERLSCKICGRTDSSIAVLTTFTASTIWTQKTASVTLADDYTGLRFQLSNVGECWLTKLIVSRSPIDYDYSVKTKLEDIEPKVALLDGNISIEQFNEQLRDVFAYKYSSQTLDYEDGYIKIDGTHEDHTSCHYAIFSVQSNDRFKITTAHGSALRAYVLVDSNGNVVDYYPTDTISTVTDTVELTVPTNGTLYVNTYKTAYTFVSKVTGLTVADGGSELAGKTWFALGDSITAYATGYHAIIGEETGAIVTNGGISGSGYMKPINNQTFVDRANLSSVYDVVTVFGSVNDMQYVAEYLGTESDTGTATLGGCFNTLIDNLYASGNYHIGIISPIPQGSTNGNPANTTGTVAQYTELLEKVCRRRGVPYLDLWRCSNMQPWDTDFAENYMQDGTHPNTEGHKIFAPRIKAFIQSL